MTLMDVAHDFAVVSILLAIGYFLRMKVKLFPPRIHYRGPDRPHNRASDSGAVLSCTCHLYRQHQ